MPWITLKEDLAIPIPRTAELGDNRWACQIEGEADDIADLSEVLNTPPAIAGYKVASIGTVTALTCHLWNTVDDASQVQALADAALNQCVACINMLNVCGAMKIGTLYEFKADGTCTMQRFSKIKINIKKAKNNRASPRAIQWLILLAAEEKWLSDCLPVFYEEPTYYSIYKAIEAIRHHCNGEVSMCQRNDLNGNKLLQVKRVADYHRHIQQPTRARPNPFYSVDDCVSVVKEALSVLINNALNARGFNKQR